jgi:formamidopyrimidine-DNA glycosylase
MPELPELEVVCEVLKQRVIGQSIVSVAVLPPGGPIVVRDLTNEGFEKTLVGKSFVEVKRRGKYLVFTMTPGNLPLYLVLNSKLTGRLQLTDAASKKMPKTHVIISLSGERQLRYVDQKRMGQLYLTHDLNAILDFAGMGPEPLEVSLEEFKARLKHHHGEIKGALTRGEFLAGIGNAYADEILWGAKLYPYRRISQLSSVDIEGLYSAMRETLLSVCHARAVGQRFRWSEPTSASPISAAPASREV